MGIWERVFGGRARTTVRIMGEQFAMANPKAWRSTAVRETVDAIARHAAKLKPVHMQGNEVVHDGLERLLQVRPNPYMNTLDMLYKVVAQREVTNNAFLYLKRKNGILLGVYPVDYTHAEFEQDQYGGLIVRFDMLNGKRFFADYGDLIHLRKFYLDQPLMGADNMPLDDVTELINTFNAGTLSGIRNGTLIRGVLKTIKKALNAADLRRRRDEFIEDSTDMERSHGVATLDADQEYTQLDPSKLYTVRPDERKEISTHMYKYFGVNEKIVSAEYTEDEWNAFYESVLEPIAVQLSLEFTAKLFTPQQREEGHSIVFEANRLQYASASTKINLVNTLGMLGIIRQNEGREVFNMPPVDGGDKLIENWNKTGGGRNAADDGN